MTHTEIAHWVVDAVAILGVIWNKLNIKNLGLQLDGFRINYTKSEKASSFRKGQDNDRAGENEDRENLK
jgi:hypothetical protein